MAASGGVQALGYLLTTMSDPRYDAIAQHAFSGAPLLPPLAARALRLIELPPGLVGVQASACPLGVLIARNEATDAGFGVYQNKNYALDGNPADSYELLATHDRFARHGLLVSDYAEDTRTIDETESLVIALDGPDTTLDTMTAFDGLADTLLVFLGGEVLSVLSVALVASGVYALAVVRNRFGSPREAHTAGDEAYLIERNGLLHLEHPHFQPYNTCEFKVPLQNGAGYTELGDLAAVELQLAGRLFAEPPLTNLSVNSNRSSPSYAAGQKIEIAWTPTAAEGAFLLPDRCLVRAKVELLNPADEVVFTQRTERSSLRITNAQLQAALGGETDFSVKIYREVNTPDALVVSEPLTLAVLKA